MAAKPKPDSSRGSNLTRSFLVVALLCFGGALALSVLAPRWNVPDRISFVVTSGYVVFMLLFLLRARAAR